MLYIIVSLVKHIGVILPFYCVNYFSQEKGLAHHYVFSIQVYDRPQYSTQYYSLVNYNFYLLYNFYMYNSYIHIMYIFHQCYIKVMEDGGTAEEKGGQAWVRKCRIATCNKVVGSSMW